MSGRSFDPVSSGRDKGLGYRYFLACAFSVPLPFEDSGEYSDDQGKGALPSEDPPPAGVADRDELVEVSDDDMDLERLFEAMGKVVRSRARSKRPEEPDSVPGKLPSEDPEPPLPPPKDPPPVRTRTLCLGIPLRSKRGREVCGAVQSLINKLEAFGFPVHRYHADRAQELKSRQLVAWLRDRGIHGTWTPGDTPAGSKAELAVQQLKGLSCKLLQIAELDSVFWPLAVLHASSRNWVELCSALGAVQPTLLPFGVRLHARQRTATGFQSHWRSRTVAGKYLGLAPHTPGGHLVLIPDAHGDKILLTNTVYPLKSSIAKVPKPKYRLRSKTADFVIRAVRAVPLARSVLVPGCARFAPGGEWGSKVFFRTSQNSSGSEVDKFEDESSSGSDSNSVAQVVQQAGGIEQVGTCSKTVEGDVDAGLGFLDASKTARSHGAPHFR